MGDLRTSFSTLDGAANGSFRITNSPSQAARLLSLHLTLACRFIRRKVGRSRCKAPAGVGRCPLIGGPILGGNAALSVKSAHVYYTRPCAASFLVLCLEQQPGNVTGFRRTLLGDHLADDQASIPVLPTRPGEMRADLLTFRVDQVRLSALEVPGKTLLTCFAAVDLNPGGINLLNQMDVCGRFWYRPARCWARESPGIEIKTG